LRILASPTTPQSGLSLESRTLRHAANASPSVQALAIRLRVERSELERCLTGDATVPRDTFLRALELIMDDMDGRERRAHAGLRRGQSWRVLVVDDNVDSTATLSALLEQMGHEVEVAHDGLEALHAARRKRPDFLLLDITLPGLDGFAVASALRGEPGFGALRIVALTGWVGEEERRRSREVGIDHYLVKPVDLAFIESLLGRPAREGSG
jgi:CheY-like chemotaxis protein